MAPTIPPRTTPTAGMGIELNAVHISNLTYDYGDRRALDDVSLDIDRGEIFALLGPNGSGKSTMFRVLSTLVPPKTGAIEILGLSIPQHVAAVRARIGVVFQSPGLDKKLTVWENLAQQAALYGLTRTQFRQRADEMLSHFGLRDRRHDRVQELSGGLRRRVELAKGMLHQPELLLMDEPSTGLDPGARNEVWQYLSRLRTERGVTIALTTHLLDEAAKADRIAILDRGKLVAVDTPANLCAALGGDAVTVESPDIEQLASDLSARFEIDGVVVDGTLRFEMENGHAWVPRLIEAFPGRVTSIRIGRPTLEDVFIRRTGRGFWEQDAAILEPKR